MVPWSTGGDNSAFSLAVQGLQFFWRSIRCCPVGGEGSLGDGSDDLFACPISGRVTMLHLRLIPYVLRPLNKNGME